MPDCFANLAKTAHVRGKRETAEWLEFICRIKANTKKQA
jgi:hypothetical protein